MFLHDNIRMLWKLFNYYSFLLDPASKHALQRFSSPYITPLLTPSDTPKIASACVSPRRYSAAVSPRRTSGSSSPTIPQFQRRVSMSSFYPSSQQSSQQSSAANSPPRARPKPGCQELSFFFPISLCKLCKCYCYRSALVVTHIGSHSLYEMQTCVDSNIYTIYTIFLKCKNDSICV